MADWRWLADTNGSQGKCVQKKILADAVTIDGRKEWICNFFSGTNVLTR